MVGDKSIVSMVVMVAELLLELLVTFAEVDAAGSVSAEQTLITLQRLAESGCLMMLWLLPERVCVAMCDCCAPIGI